MAFEVKHDFVTEKGDGQDPSLLQPSHWNAPHKITVDAGRLLGRRPESDGDAEQISLDGLVLETNVLRNPLAGATGADTLIGTEPATPEEAAPNARVATNSDTIGWDKAVANKIKANLLPDSVTPAMLKNGVQGEIIIFGEDGVAERLPPGEVGQVLVAGGPDVNVAWEASAGGAPHAVLQCRRTAGTDDGSTVAGQFQLRTINTEVYDALDVIELGTGVDVNKFKFEAGEYVVAWSAPCFGAVGKHQARLRQLVDGVTVASGSSSSCSAAASTLSNGVARFEPDPEKWYGIQHRCVNAVAGNGFGEACGFGEMEVYTQVNIWRVGEATPTP